MEILSLSNDVLLVTLPVQQGWCNELTAVNQIIADKGDYDVIVDFTEVQIMVSLILGKLIELNKLVHKSGHRLILCNVSFLSKCVFRVAGLRSSFEFADDKYAASAAIQRGHEQKVEK